MQQETVRLPQGARNRAASIDRAQITADLGCRYLQVDATDHSRPILQRLGFTVLTPTTPYVYQPRPDDREAWSDSATAARQPHDRHEQPGGRPALGAASPCLPRPSTPLIATVEFCRGVSGKQHNGGDITWPCD